MSQPWHDGQVIYKNGDAAQPMAIAATAEDAAVIVSSLARNESSAMNLYDLLDAAAEINGGHPDELTLCITPSGATLKRGSRCVASVNREDGEPCHAFAAELANQCTNLIDIRDSAVASAESVVTTARVRRGDALKLMERLRAYADGSAEVSA